MRIMVMFDLPAQTAADLREYQRFRKFLIKSGFVMLQESVYTKLAVNQTAASLVVASIRKNKPSNGLVALLMVTEKQFAKMEFIAGEHSSEIIESDERLIVL